MPCRIIILFQHSGGICWLIRVNELGSGGWMLESLTEGNVFLGWWLKIAVYWDITLCSLVKVYWHLEVSDTCTIMVDEQSTCDNEFTVIVVMTNYILQTSHSGLGSSCVTGLAVLTSWIGHLWLRIASTCDIRSTSNIPVCLPTNSRYVDHTASEVTELNFHSHKMDRKDSLISGRLADCTGTFCFGQSSLTLRTV
jgi:hypothetical protein